MALVYYDIFTFFLLLTVGGIIEERKKAALILLPMSLFLVGVSAYFFSDYVSSYNEITYYDGTNGVENPFLLLTSYFVIIWIANFNFPFILSRGGRWIYFAVKKKTKKEQT